MKTMFGFIRDASISIQEKLKIGPYSEPKTELSDKTTYMIHMKNFQKLLKNALKAKK